MRDIKITIFGVIRSVIGPSSSLIDGSNAARRISSPVPSRFSLLSRYLFAVIGLVASFSVSANSGGITNQYTDGTSCSNCHGTGYNYSTTIGGDTTVAPGVNGAYSFALTRAGGGEACEGGFNIRTSGGTFNAGTSQTDAGTSGEQLTHSSPQVSDADNSNGCNAGSGNFNWSFTWDAPVTVGTYTMQGCGNPVDGDGVDDADDGSSNAGRCSTRTITVNTSPNAVNDTRTVAEDSGATSFNSTGARLTILSNDTSGGSGNETGDSRRIYRVCSSSTTSCSTSSYSNVNGLVEIVGSGTAAYVRFTPTVRRCKLVFLEAILKILEPQIQWQTQPILCMG